MMRLCCDSSCSYLGRSAQRAIGIKPVGTLVEQTLAGWIPSPDRSEQDGKPIALDEATHRVIEQKSADGIVAGSHRP